MYRKDNNLGGIMIGVIFCLAAVRFVWGGEMFPAVVFGSLGLLMLVLNAKDIINKNKKEHEDTPVNYKEKKVKKICPNCGSRNVHTTSSSGHEHEHDCFYYCYDCGRVF